MARLDVLNFPGPQPHVALTRCGKTTDYIRVSVCEGLTAANLTFVCAQPKSVLVQAVLIVIFVQVDSIALELKMHVTGNGDELPLVFLRCGNELNERHPFGRILSICGAAEAAKSKKGNEGSAAVLHGT